MLYFLRGPSDVAFILVQRSDSDWEDMGKSDKAQAKEPELASCDALPQEHIHNGEDLGNHYMPTFKDLKKKSCGVLCWKILYVVVGIITVLQSIAVIGISVTSAIATKIYSNDMSGRLVAMVVLAVTAAVTLSGIIYGVIGALRDKRRPVHSATAVLIVVIIIQAIILAVSVKVTTEDEVELGRSLSESFKLARDDNPRHVKIWARTQHDLKCCGVYTAEDYRSPKLPSYFAPNVPISCCPVYDPERSELVQERERETCKARRLFYDVGCRNLIIDVFKETSATVMGVSLLAVVLQIITILIGIILEKKNTEPKNKEYDTDAIEVVPTTPAVMTDMKTKPKS
ncbi:unnamed protein product [Parnassius apollo]|uniref:(apollo) hypothetical protein n=1 Tax=Parnassius apollo TaxID=110799 RepID=A0A8S3X980_PARAO|nr:unnamed protein product [Parnassius apollo]